MRGPRKMQRMKGNIPSQHPSRRTAYDPSIQMDMLGSGELQAPHPSAPMGKNVNYVFTTFDALPINGVNFITQSGSNPNDTGDDGQAVAYTTSSAFYVVPAGRVAILRDWQLIIVPNQGETIAEGNPIIAANGTSNFKLQLDFFVNATAQLGYSNIVTKAAGFGDLFGTSYIIAQEGDVIEARVSRVSGGASNWKQALFALNGDLLVTRGYPAQYEPGTDAVVPTKNVDA